MMKRITQSVIVGVIYAIFFSVIVYLSMLALWLGDDITYLYNFSNGNLISSFSEIIESQWIHYFVMNGRFPAHALVQLFIALVGKTGFAIVNGLIYIAVVLLILKLCDVSHKDIMATGMVVMMYFLVFQTKYVPSCQIGYTWMFALVLFYLYLFFQKAHTLTPIHLLYLIPLSLLAGWSQEALVIGIAGALILYVLKNYHNLHPIQFSMFVMFGIGSALLCFSPANISRTTAEYGSIDFLPPIVFSLVKLLFYLRVTYLWIACLLWLFFCNKINLRTYYHKNQFWINAISILLLFNISIGVMGHHQLFGIELISLILFLRIIFHMECNKNIVKILCCIAMLLCCWKLYGDTKFTKRMQNIYDSIVSQYLHNELGVVYYDLTNSDVTFIGGYPTDTYSPHVLKTIGRHLHSQYNLAKTLRVYPSCCLNLQQPGYDNSWIDIDKNSHQVILSKAKIPTAVKLHREIIVGPIRYPILPLVIRSFEHPVYENDYYKVFIIHDKFPFITGHHVEFIFDQK